MTCFLLYVASLLLDFQTFGNWLLSPLYNGMGEKRQNDLVNK